MAGCSLFRGKTAEEILKKNEACKNIKKKKKLNNLSRNRKNYLLLIIQNFIVRNLLYKMLEKSPTKRIELRDIFMSKWVKKKGCLTNTFEKKKCFLNKNESEPILLIHKNSASEDFSKMKQTKISWFKKTYEDNSNALFFDIEDRKIKFSNNNVTPKFFSHINNNNEDKINDYSDKTGDNDQKFSNDLQKDTSSIAYYPKSEILSDNSIESDSFSFKNESKALLKTKKKQNEELINNLTKDNIEAISTLRTRRAYDIDLPQMMQKMKQTDFKWKKF